MDGEGSCPPQLLINISSVEVQDGYLGKLALYKVVSSDNTNHKTAICLKRFNQFLELDTQLAKGAQVCACGLFVHTVCRVVSSGCNHLF